MTVVALASTGFCTPAQTDLHHAIVAERAEHGIATLAPSPHATTKAQQWAEHLATTGQLRHSNLADGMPPGFAKLGENVGRGPSIDAILDGFAASPEHHANLLDPAYDWLGTGTATATNGTVYVVVILADY